MPVKAHGYLWLCSESLKMQDLEPGVEDPAGLTKQLFLTSDASNIVFHRSRCTGL